MSYCRFGADSDVYVFEASWGIECCGCLLRETPHHFDTPAEMIAHLERHVAAGHRVPEDAFARLREEAAG